MTFLKLQSLAVFAVLINVTLSATVNEWNIHNHIFDLTNKHRAHSILRFSISGAQVVSVKSENASDKTRVELSDHKVIEIRHIDTHQANITEYEVTWINAGPNLEHEVCFNYGHNKASWQVNIFFSCYFFK